MGAVQVFGKPIDKKVYTKYATGTIVGSTGNLSITNLKFMPKKIIYTKISQTDQANNRASFGILSNAGDFHFNGVGHIGMRVLETDSWDDVAHQFTADSNGQILSNGFEVNTRGSVGDYKFWAYA